MITNYDEEKVISEENISEKENLCDDIKKSV